MSVRVMSWVWEHSKSAGTDRLVLLAIADSAEDDGGQAWPSAAALARKTGMDVRTVQRTIRRLIELGELRVKMNAGKNGSNVYRVVMKTPGTPPPPRHTATPAERRPRQSATPAERPSGGGAAPPEPSLTRPTDGLRPSASEAEPRLDVERLCAHLSDRIEGNGSKRPTITVAWRKSARLMLDQDGHTEQQITAAIDWCQNDEFWRCNIMSMPKLRAKYDQLRLAAQRTRASPRSRPTPDQRIADIQALKDPDPPRLELLPRNAS